MTVHAAPHPYAGKTLKLDITMHGLDKFAAHDIGSGVQEYRVEDWWDRIAGKSWMHCDGNFAALGYAARSGALGLPLNDEVVYGKVGGLGFLIHNDELLAAELA